RPTSKPPRFDASIWRLISMTDASVTIGGTESLPPAVRSSAVMLENRSNQNSANTVNDVAVVNNTDLVIPGQCNRLSVRACENRSARSSSVACNGLAVGCTFNGEAPGAVYGHHSARR